MFHRTFTAIAITVLLSFTAPVLATNHMSGLAVSNSPGGTTTYGCRSQAQVCKCILLNSMPVSNQVIQWNQLANDAKSQGFKIIRIIGFDCNALDLASSAAASAGLQIMAGIYAQSVNEFNDVQTFRAAYTKYGAGRYVGLTVGNEVQDSVGNIMAKVYDVRGYLGSVGVTTPVSTVHTWVDIRNNPALCGADFVGANAHAFYDGGVNSGQAGSFLYNTVKPALQAACPGKKIYITETGWPSRGSNNGNAAPSVPDEHNAISSINCAARDTSMTIFAFEYDDQLWKTGGAVEQSFGIFGKILPGDALNAC
ncbi:Cell surface mannoprotein MP65 [Psilocybe cubensis]|uniref:Cell surface mannoprotein MP65 n=1 Tax=Psilocybe cubensis TaxID=181762 RepID=A0ACB8H203_PSICU|nr:Cell surface mannoprotein MP65 [Psilocybe cubensis]KAH9481813.1 Cell surface mannoprotein MP65 [Psilocybe cubensis]